MRKGLLYTGGAIAFGLAVTGLYNVLSMIPALITLEWGCHL